MVPLAQRDVETLGQMEEHLAARLRAPRLDEAEVPGRDRRSRGQLELAEMSALPPGTEQRADGWRTNRDGHARDTNVALRHG
jgi:hypothetical protein